MNNNVNVKLEVMFISKHKIIIIYNFFKYIKDSARGKVYSTVTDLARLRGWSTSVPRSTATW